MSGMRERRQAIQAHLAEQRARADELIAQQRAEDEARLHVVEQETGYRPLFRESATITAFMAKCMKCGAVVLDQEMHTAWHDSL